jgi:hypothetical protein
LTALCLFMAVKRMDNAKAGLLGGDEAP